jgi:hypothetical protein
VLGRWRCVKEVTACVEAVTASPGLMRGGLEQPGGGADGIWQSENYNTRPLVRYPALGGVGTAHDGCAAVSSPSGGNV